MQPLVAVTRSLPQSATCAFAGRSVLARRAGFCPLLLQPDTTDEDEKLRYHFEVATEPL